MTWHNPVPFDLIGTAETDSYKTMPEGMTGVPMAPHPGGFGVRRRCHIHEGVDLYVPEGTEVRAVEDGMVTACIAFTGPNAEPPSKWWHDTQALLVHGASGTVVYGEIRIVPGIAVGDRIAAGGVVGHVLRVLTKETPRPAAMLHLELHAGYVTDAWEWPIDGVRPPSLLDPTPHLLECVKQGPVT